MKTLIALALALASSLAWAQPFLQTRDPYPFPSGVPQSAYTFTAKAAPGGNLTCTVNASGTPRCNVGTLLGSQPPGSVTFDMTVSRAAGCNAAGDTCWGAAAATSVPFVLTWHGATVAAPTGLGGAP